ncbi:MAG TPA: TasA family protein [Frankiaceae bacterium]
MGGYRSERGPAHRRPPQPSGAHRTRRVRRGGRRGGVVVGFAGGALLAGTVAYAVLSAVATNTAPQAVGAGTLSLILGSNSGSTGFTSAVANLAPGDLVYRFVSLQNNGTLDGTGLTLGVTGTGSTRLTSDATFGLKLTLDGCSVAWTTGSATGSCGGTQTSQLASSAVAGLGTPAALTTTTLPAASTVYLRIGLALPVNSEVTTNGALPTTPIQGQSTALTYTFAVTQRSAATTSG